MENWWRYCDTSSTMIVSPWKMKNGSTMITSITIAHSFWNYFCASEILQHFRSNQFFCSISEIVIDIILTNGILNFTHHNRAFILILSAHLKYYNIFDSIEKLQHFRFNRKSCSIPEIVIDIIMTRHILFFDKVKVYFSFD